MISALGERGVLLKEERYAHKYPYDWRTKLPTIFRATPQACSHMQAPQLSIGYQRNYLLPSTMRALRCSHFAQAVEQH